MTCTMTSPPFRTHRGLTQAEASRRLALEGANVLDEPRSRGLETILAGTLREPMFLLLAAAAGLYLALGDLSEGLFMVAGASLSIGLTVMQEARSERALAALRKLAEPTARVVRDGAEARVPALELVRGDIILIGEGERPPADAGLIEGGATGMFLNSPKPVVTPYSVAGALPVSYAAL